LQTQICDNQLSWFRCHFSLSTSHFRFVKIADRSFAPIDDCLWTIIPGRRNGELNEIEKLWHVPGIRQANELDFRNGSKNSQKRSISSMKIMTNIELEQKLTEVWKLQTEDRAGILIGSVSRQERTNDSIDSIDRSLKKVGTSNNSSIWFIKIITIDEYRRTSMLFLSLILKL
jgi:hypothetical protein